MISLQYTVWLQDTFYVGHIPISQIPIWNGKLLEINGSLNIDTLQAFYFQWFLFNESLCKRKYKTWLIRAL